MSNSKLTKHGFQFVNWPGGEAAAEHFGISHAVVIPANARTIIVGGQLGIRADDTIPATLEEEVTEAFLHVEYALKAAGLGDDAWEHVYSVQTFETSAESGERVEQVVVSVARKFLKNCFPTWTGVRVAGLAVPGVHVEITVKAFLP